MAMRVAVIGEGGQAEAHVAWYRQAGLEVLPVAPAASADLAEADLYHLCGDLGERAAVVGAVLRRRRVALLLSGAVVARAADAERLARAVVRRRGRAALVGGWRFVPAFARLRELVSGGILGAIRSVRLEVRVPVDELAATRPAALDLGWWLAGDGAAEAQSSGPANTCFQAGTAVVDVTVCTGAPGATAQWSVALVAELGEAVGSASFVASWPGRPGGPQSLQVTLGGRTRPLAVPAADPCGGELGAVLAREAAGLPWLAVCGAERLARLAALGGAADVKVHGELSGPG